MDYLLALLAAGHHLATQPSAGRLLDVPIDGAGDGGFGDHLGGRPAGTAVILLKFIKRFLTHPNTRAIASWDKL